MGSRSAYPPYEMHGASSRPSKGFHVFNHVHPLPLGKLIPKRMPLIPQAESGGVIKEMGLMGGSLRGGKFLIADLVELPADVLGVVLVKIGGWRSSEAIGPGR